MLFPRLIAALASVSLAAGSVVKTANPNEETFELLILHNNDMHARFEQTSQLSGACTTADRDAGKCYGGFPRVAYVVKEARKAAATGQGPPVLYLNAGDTYTGTAWFTIYKWKIAAEFINALQPDAVSLGNHEFDNGVAGLIPFIQNVTCPVLAANLVLDNELALKAENNLLKSVIFDMNGKKVGVIGYLTPETKTLAIGNNVEYIDEVTALREEVAKLKNQSVNILIALGHSGFSVDLNIAKEVEDIDLVIGGHTNTFLWNGTAPDSEKPEGPYPTLVTQKSGRIVPVVQAYALTKYLGELKMVFDSQGEMVSYEGSPLLLDSKIPQDPEVLNIIYKYRESVQKVTEVVVGQTAVNFDVQSCRRKECNLGNLITDAMVYKYAKDYRNTGWTDAPIAIIQRGGIRAPIVRVHLPADVTQGDFLSVLPFDGHMMKVKINGSDILKMLEHSVHSFNPIKTPGEFLEMSGMKVVYDVKKRPGMRVVNVQLLCGMCDTPEYLPLNKTKEYQILMSSFLAKGGDHYDVFKGLPAAELPYNELDSVIEYTRSHSPLRTAVDGRITLYNVDKMKVNLNNSATYLSTSSIMMVVVFILTFMNVINM